MRAIAEHDFPRLARPVFGRANPERVDNPLWELAIRENLGGFELRKRFRDARRAQISGSATAGHRLWENGPVWCWRRFGQTRTELPDGRVIHVGGEYEDFYDPDFCIFNDVIIEHPNGVLEIHAYPLDAFPPTDFHSATLIGDAIILIGSLGYRDHQHLDRCQVARLDLPSLRIDRIDSAGEGPGWLSRHDAQRIGASEILVMGGRVLERDPADAQKRRLVDNPALFALDVASWTWRVVPHAEPSIFPVSAEAYRAGRAPVIGAANPERLDHAFKREAARLGWRPKRARLHFGDPPPPQPEDRAAVLAARPIAEVVWTAARSRSAEVTLDDGVRLVIAGAFDAFGEEWADRWAYNDIIRFAPDGAVEIFAYPLEDFPPLLEATALRDGARILIFGFVPPRHAPLARQMAALALDPATMRIRLLDAIRVDTRAMLDKPPPVVTAEAIDFHVLRRRAEDPQRRLRFDRRAERWQLGAD